MTEFGSWLKNLDKNIKFNVELYCTSGVTGFNNVQILDAIETPNDILVVFQTKDKIIYIKLSEIRYMEVNLKWQRNN